MAAWWKDWDFDVRPLLSSIQAPTLVMRHEANVLAPAQAAVQYVTDAIPGPVGPVPIPGRDLELWAQQPPMLLDEIERFVTGSIGQHVAASDRAFAVVLYADLVESTPQAAAMGYRRWRALLEVHNNPSVRQIEKHSGRLVKSTGDGVLAVSMGPARAERCAQAIVGEVRARERSRQRGHRRCGHPLPAGAGGGASPRRA